MDGKQLFVFLSMANSMANSKANSVACSMAKSMASSIANSNFMAKHPLKRNQIIAHEKVIGQVTRS